MPGLFPTASVGQSLCLPISDVEIPHNAAENTNRMFFRSDSISDSTSVAEPEGCKVQSGIMWVSHTQKISLRQEDSSSCYHYRPKIYSGMLIVKLPSRTESELQLKART
jgi:hypothetical protein